MKAMNCDLRCRNINVYFDVSDLPIIWEDFKGLRHDFKRVHWYWKPVWLVLHAISLTLFLVMLALIFFLFGVYVVAMVFRYPIIKITPYMRDFANKEEIQ